MSTTIVQEVKTALISQLDEARKAIHSLAEPLSEKQFWTKPVDPGNSFGHLVLHLTGNLNHFVGAQLGNTGYVRDREREFTETNVPSKRDALARLDEAVAVYQRVVESLSDEALLAAHPDPKRGITINALIFLLSHFTLHRGQMSYIARLV